MRFGWLQRLLSKTPGENDSILPVDATGIMMVTAEQEKTSITVHEYVSRFPRGSTIDHYIILGPLGRGGMGEVYKAYDQRLDRAVALKFVTIQSMDRRTMDKLRVRLLKEAKLLARLYHPNVVAVFDVNTFKDDVFVTMELVEGKTLDEWIQEEKPSPQKVLEVLIAAGKGLAAAHRSGIIHRDFKPTNLIVGTDGRARILDFGVALAKDRARSEQPGSVDQLRLEYEETKLVEVSGEIVPVHSPRVPDGDTKSHDSSGRGTRPGTFVGTLAYMAPEQFIGQSVDGRADQFSFCVVLFEALYGVMPFMEDGVLDRITGKVNPFPAGHDVPTWVQPILLKGLAKDPQQRFLDMDGLLEALEHHHIPAPAQAVPLLRKRLLVPVVLLFGVLGAWGLWRWNQPERALLGQAAREVAAIWGPEQKQALGKGFLSTGRAHAASTVARLSRRLDDYAAAWVAERVAATAGSGPGQAARQDRQVTCLEQDLLRVGGVLDVLLGKPDPGLVDKAWLLASSLEDPRHCAEERGAAGMGSLPGEALPDAKTQALSRNLYRLEALWLAGRVKEGLAMASSVEQEAMKTNDRLLQAKALLILGRLQDAGGDPQTAEQTLYAAAQAALDARSARLSIESWSQACFVVGCRQARYEAALALRRNAEVILVFGENNPALRAALLESLGEVQLCHRRIAEAKESFQQAVSLREKIGAPARLELAAQLIRLSGLYLATNEPDRGRQVAAQGLSILEDDLGPEHPDLGGAQRALGQTLVQLGRFDEAALLLGRALSLQRETLGNAHPEVARTLIAQARLDDVRGQFRQARQGYERALSILEDSLGRDHPDLALSLGPLADFYMSELQLAPALTTLQRLLTLQRRSLGADHPDLARTLEALARLYELRGETYRSVEGYERALSIAQKHVGSVHPEVARLQLRLGDAWAWLDESAKATVCYQRALFIQKTAKEEPHLAMADTLLRLGRTTEDAESFAVAGEAYEQALLHREKILGPDHPDLAEILTRLARVQAARQGCPAAEKLFTRAESIVEKTLGASRLELIEPLIGRGDCLLLNNHAAQATGLLERAVRLSQVPGGDERLLADASFALARALRVAGQSPARARELALKAESVFRKAASLRNQKKLSRIQAWLATAR